MRGIGGLLLGRYRLAIEPLLQIVEWRDLAVAHHEQFAIHRNLAAGEGRGDLRKAAGYVVAIAREHPDPARTGGHLNADTVPFPFGREVLWVEPRPVAVFDGRGQHERTEHRPSCRIGPVHLARRPAEQLCVRRLQRVPDLLDFGCVLAEGFGERRLGQPRRHAHARRPADELQQRPASGDVEPVEVVRQQRPHGRRRRELQPRDDVAELRWLTRPGVRPQQRDRLGRIAHEIAGKPVQHRIDALGHQLRQDTPERHTHRQPVGQRRQRPAAIRVGRLAEIVREQCKLSRPALRVAEIVEQAGEALHG